MIGPFQSTPFDPASPSKPKRAGPLINIDARETSGMIEMKDMLQKLAQQQRDLIAQGVTAKEIAAQKIIDMEMKEF